MSATAVVDELLEYLRPEERAELDAHLAALAPPTPVVTTKRTGQPVPADWRLRLPLVYPKHFTAGFAMRHVEMWEWANAIEPESSPDPFCAFWPRGGGKSTGAEGVAADLGCRDKRRYCLYVRNTQDMADKSVANVAALLESPETERYYPEHADRMLGKFGHAKGWRRERLTTAGGYTIDAAGLDTATRGLKFEENRPDLIIFDDIDEKLDGPHITAKKIAIITTSILPAGSNNCAVLFIQNLIIPDGVATQLADGRADFLVRRRVSGPHPAVEGLKFAWQLDETTGIRRAVITAGTATWAGQPLAACQKFIDTWGLSAFLKEAQHQVKGRAEGVALRFEPSRHFIDLTDDECRLLVAAALRSKRIALFGGLDFGAWRFGFTLWVVTGPGVAQLLKRPDIGEGVVIRLDEVFAQRLPGQEFLHQRARLIHELCAYYGVPVDAPTSRETAQPEQAARMRTLPIWGDAANPTDILEINLAFRNGWDVEVEAPNRGRGTRIEHVTSRLRVVPVASENKLRKTSVERINDLLDKNALRYRRGVAYEWRYNMNASSEGTPQIGSRLVWEAEHWSYPTPKAGVIQDQDPDDATADGADMMASKRYAIMSVFGPTQVPGDLGHYPDDKAPPVDWRKGEMGKVPHAADFLTGGRARTPAVRMPKPRGRR